MNIRELASASQTTERQIRYLIAEGFVPPPSGGRAHAVYGGEHLAAIERFSRLRSQGFPPAAIKLLLQASAGTQLPVAPGLALLLDPQLLGSGAALEPLLERIRAVLADALTKGGPHARDESRD